jgi:hypothetical protein
MACPSTAELSDLSADRFVVAAKSVKMAKRFHDKTPLIAVQRILLSSTLRTI